MVSNLNKIESTSYHERKIFPYATTEHLHMELMELTEVTYLEQDVVFYLLMEIINPEL